MNGTNDIAPASDAPFAVALARQYEMFGARARALAGGLSADEFWRKPYPYGNSVGHLLLHVTGNLNYYIGARIAASGYVRDRNREFTDSSHQPAEQVLKNLDSAVAMVVATIGAQSAADWGRAYEGAGSDEVTRAGIVLRCAEHFFHHLGQIIYLVKEHERRRTG